LDKGLGRRIALAVIVAPPTRYASIEFESAGVVESATDLREDIIRRAALTIGIVAPARDMSVIAESAAMHEATDDLSKCSCWGYGCAVRGIPPTNSPSVGLDCA
jgi:hypothetical protein